LTAEEERYGRQERVPCFGPGGQERLASAALGIVGLGALGSRLAEDLARAGVLRLRLIDRDWVEIHNLHRQHLYGEDAAREAVPKVLAAAERLADIRKDLTLEPELADLDPSNADRLLGDLDLILDGTDNFQSRYLINDWCAKNGVPWIYGACVGTEAMAAAFRPEGPCLRCLFPEAPPAERNPTCETAGILPSAAATAASLQLSLCLRLLGRPEDPPPSYLLVAETWTPEIRRLRFPEGPVDTCPTCTEGSFPALSARLGSRAMTLCGRDAVQITPPEGPPPDLEVLASRLPPETEAVLQAGMLRLRIPEGRITLFRDGRAIVQGTKDPGKARALYDRWLGT